MDSLTAGDLRIEPVEANGLIQILWQGRSTDRSPSKILSPYFAGVLDDAGGRKKPLELHFEKLEHFNSATVTAIIQIIQDARAKSVRLVMVFDQSLKWQKLSFDALRVFVKPDSLLELRPV